MSTAGHILNKQHYYSSLCISSHVINRNACDSCIRCNHLKFLTKMSQDEQPIQKAHVVQTQSQIKMLDKQQTTASFKQTTVGQSHKSRCNHQVHNTRAGFLSQYSHKPQSNHTMPPSVYRLPYETTERSPVWA